MLLGEQTLFVGMVEEVLFAQQESKLVMEFQGFTPFLIVLSLNMLELSLLLQTEASEVQGMQPRHWQQGQTLLWWAHFSQGRTRRQGK